MTLRSRLMLWFGALFTVMLLFTLLVSYAFHARVTYDDIDQAMATTASHTVVELLDVTSPPIFIEGQDGFRVLLRVLAPSGVIRASSLSAASVPQVDLRQLLHAPNTPAFDVFAQIAPSLLPHQAASSGSYSVITTTQQRWRSFVLPYPQQGTPLGYVVALTPLGQVDAAIQAYRLILVGIVVISLGITLLGSCFVAGQALRPVARMIVTAQNITASHDLSHRLDLPAHGDELGQLARVINAMLASIESAYQGQQRFVADASHELRAPLTAILANLSLLRRHQQLPQDERDEALAEAEREGGRLSRLVADLLALARADAGSTIAQDVIDLDALVLDLFRTARQLAHGHTVQIDPFEPVQIVGDGDRLKQVLLVLVDNAIKYTAATGSITLGIHQHDHVVDLIVQDTGVGISAADLPHIFERFYRADAARSRDAGGTGLGLAIAQWIVDQHHGTMLVQSHLQQGTTMTVRLPLQPNPQVALRHPS